MSEMSEISLTQMKNNCVERLLVIDRSINKGAHPLTLQAIRSALGGQLLYLLKMDTFMRWMVAGFIFSLW